MDGKDPLRHLPLTPQVFQILLSLLDDDLHGYAIIQEVSERTGGRVKLGSGTLYAAIRRLLEAEMIAESDERPPAEQDDERRKYYRITDFGRRVAAAEAERLAELVDQATEKELITRLHPASSKTD